MDYYAGNRGHMYGDCIKLLMKKQDARLPFIAEVSLEESHRDPATISAAELRKQPDAAAASQRVTHYNKIEWCHSIDKSR